MAYVETWVPRGEHRIYFRDHPGEEPAVVLMHGFPDNLHLYDRLVPRMNPPRRVITFDFLGWGRSDKPGGYPYTAANQTGDLDAVIVHLGLDRPVVVAELYEQFRPQRAAFFSLNADLLGTTISRRKRFAEMRSFAQPVLIIFGAADPYLNAGVANRFHRLFPTSDLFLLPNARHYVQIDDPVEVA